MSEPSHCPSCGAALPTASDGGICLACMLEGGLETTGGPEGDTLPMAEREGDASPAFSEKAGDRIGPYTLLQKIGEGGFGVVWMAGQREPIHRKVALKVIKAGMDTKEVLARFEAERQALAMMDHPHIAKVLDAGATPAGRPWFAMELVKGIPITEFCDEQKLGTRARLELFREVCSAISHAHQKGIIHRDLKPSNVLVSLRDDEPVVKVIDFGIAKALHGPLTEKTLFTRFEQLLGTPQYMSPEQAGKNGLDIDTRSDIYSLGVLLYELLTGRPPFDGKTLVSAGYEEMCRIIREEDPPKPSLKLTTASGEEQTRIFSSQGIEPRKLSRQFRGELDWIVMKALEKERARRYETASAFGADIGRYLAQEPVEAGPPSAAYRFRKFARRNKAAIGMASLIAAVLVAATGVSTWQAVEAHRARVQSEKDKEEAEAIATFLSEVFRSPDPARDGRTIQVAELLDKAVKKLETELADQPKRRVRLQAALANTFEALGCIAPAVSLKEKVRDWHYENSGARHSDTFQASLRLAASYKNAGRADEALKLREEAYSGLRETLGPEHPATLLAMHDFARALLEMHELPMAPLVDRRDEALKLLEEVFKFRGELQGREHPDTLKAMRALAMTYRGLGRRDEGLKLAEEALRLCRQVLGPNHPETLATMADLVAHFNGMGRNKEALELHEEVFELRRRRLGPEHPYTMETMALLSGFYETSGRWNEALKLREELLTLRQKVLGPEHPGTLSAMALVASSYENAGRGDEAAKLREKVVTLRRKVLGPMHPSTLAAVDELYDDEEIAHWDDDWKWLNEPPKWNQGESEWKRPDAVTVADAISRRPPPAVSPKGAAPIYHFVQSKRPTQQNSVIIVDEALEREEEALALGRKLNGTGSRETVALMNTLAASYLDAGRVDDGGKLLVEWWLISGEAQGVGNDEAIVSKVIEAFRTRNTPLVDETPSQESLTAYFDKHRDQFADTRLHLLIISGKKPERDRAFMESLRNDLGSGESWEAAARAHSDDSSASSGGDRGWVKRDDLREDLWEAAFALESGQISGVIEDEAHFRLLKVVERKAGPPPTLDQVREAVAEAVAKEAEQARVRRWIEEVRKGSESQPARGDNLASAAQAGGGSESARKTTPTPEELKKLGSILLSEKTDAFLFRAEMPSLPGVTPPRIVVAWRAPDQAAMFWIDPRDNTPLLVALGNRTLFYDPMNLVIRSVDQGGVECTLGVDEKGLSYHFGAPSKRSTIRLDFASLLGPVERGLTASQDASTGLHWLEGHTAKGNSCEALIDPKGRFALRSLKLTSEDGEPILSMDLRDGENLGQSDFFTFPEQSLQASGIPVSRSESVDPTQWGTLLPLSILVRAAISDPALRNHKEAFSYLRLHGLDGEALAKQFEQIDWNELEKRDAGIRASLRRVFSRQLQEFSK